MNKVSLIVIPGLGDSRETGIQRIEGRVACPWVSDRAVRVRDDGYVLAGVRNA
jgi:hypothetical protein